MAEGSEKATGNGTAAVIDAAPVSSPNMEGETDAPVQRTVTTVDKIQLKPKRGRPAGSGSQQLAARPARNACATLIDGTVGDPSMRITCERRAPNYLQLGDAIPQGPMSAIQEFLERTHGPGSYRISVTQDGIVVPPLDGGSCEIQIAGKSPEVEESEDLKSVKLKTAKINEEKKQAEAKRELNRAQREIEQEEAEAKRAAKDAEASPVLAEIAELKAALKEATKPKPSEWTIEKIAMLITAAAPIIAMFKPVKDDSIKEVLQTINESNRQQTEKLMKLLEAKSEKSRDDLSTLDIYMKVKKDLREENKEFQDRLAALVPRGGDDDVDIDPNNIWGSLAAAGVKGIIHLFKTGGPGMVEAIQTIAANVGKKPEQLTTGDEAAVQRAIAEASAAQRMRPLPAPPAPQQPPQVRMPLGPPRPLQMVQPPRMNAPANGVPPQAPAAVLNTPVVAEAVGAPRKSDETGSPESTRVTTAETETGSTHAEKPSESIVDSSAAGALPVDARSLPAATFKLDDPKLEQDLVLEIDKSIDDMVIDIQQGRVIRGSAMVWVDEALDRWSLDFLKHLETIPNHMDRYKVIRSKASADRLEALDNALMAEDKKLDESPKEKLYLWNNFHNGFEVLVRAFQERQKERKA